MEFWSEGLGKKHLEIPLKKTTSSVEGEALYLRGITTAPAEWEYRVTMSPADWKYVLQIATCQDTVQYIKESISFGQLIKLAIPILKFAILMMFVKPSVPAVENTEAEKSETREKVGVA